MQQIREDRILDEAHASRGDTRRVSDLFGLSIQAASRYTEPVEDAASSANAERDRRWHANPNTRITGQGRLGQQQAR